MTNVSISHAAMDISIMDFAGIGRSEKQWIELLNVVELRIVKTMLSGPPEGEFAFDSIIEAVRK